MSNDSLSDFMLNLASGLTQTLLEAGASHLDQVALDTDDWRLLHAAIDHGIAAPLTDIYEQLPDGDDRREKLASTLSAAANYRQSDKDPCFYSGELLVQAPRIII